MQISGSSAIVVGGAGGLGEATVRRLHAAGAKVVIADLADEKGKALADELDARYVRTDATNTLDLDGFKTTIDVYLTGVFNVLRLAAAAIARQEPVDEGARGVIINTASIAAYEGQIGQLPYAAAKGGVVSMTLVAARDLSPLGIRVVTIAPGTFLTPAYGKAGDQLEAYWGPQVPFPRRMGRSAEYGAFVQSIVENDYLNGEVIRLDGALRFPPK
jgi:NAD(P)-dependent dehydrogenase (short-subunit alcohol dehydrogenase family)